MERARRSRRTPFFLNLTLEFCVLASMLTLLAAVVAQAPVAPVPGWSMYVSTQDHFTVELPGKPAITTQTASSQGVSGTTHNYTVKTLAINAVVSATVLSSASPQVMQDVAKGIKLGLMRRIGGKPGPDIKAVYSGRTGTETRFQDASGHFGALWVTTTPGKVYALTVLAPKGVPKAEAKRFFTSFHLG